MICGSCGKIYIGQTGRAFWKRIKEHLDKFRLKSVGSNYASHLIDEGHSLNDKFEILHVCTKGKKLDHLESMEINRQKHKNILLNDKKDLNFSPLLNLFVEK